MKFRFTIRDLLWLTALCAMGVAWWLDRARLTKPSRYLLADPSQTNGPFVIKDTKTGANTVVWPP
jgi:hypothetical protein